MSEKKAAGKHGAEETMELIKRGHDPKDGKKELSTEEKMEQGKVEIMKGLGGVNGAEKLAELIERGKKKGHLSSGELMDVLENMDLESEQMDKIYDTLENLGIDTVGDDYLPELADDTLPPLEELNEIEDLPEEEMVDPNSLMDTFGTDDPVRMYLKEIGKVNLLTSDEEIGLAQDMNAGTAAQEQLEELEKAGEEIPQEYDIRGLQISKVNHKCFLFGEELSLTPLEFSILWYLCSRQSQVVSSEELFEAAWGEKYMDSNNTVMSHIARLREKMHENSRKPKFIKTVWGVGYTIE